MKAVFISLGLIATRSDSAAVVNGFISSCFCFLVNAVFISSCFVIIGSFSGIGVSTGFTSTGSVCSCVSTTVDFILFGFSAICSCFVVTTVLTSVGFAAIFSVFCSTLAIFIGFSFSTFGVTTFSSLTTFLGLFTPFTPFTPSFTPTFAGFWATFPNIFALEDRIDN